MGPHETKGFLQGNGQHQKQEPIEREFFFFNFLFTTPHLLQH